MFKSKTIRDNRLKDIESRLQNVSDSKTDDKSYEYRMGSLLIPPDPNGFMEPEDKLEDYNFPIPFKTSFPIDETQELMSHIVDIKHLIETQYTFKGTSFYGTYLKTDNLYKKYSRLFLGKKDPNKKIHRERVRIFTILTDVLYPYYVRKYGSTAATQEDFIMATMYYYFSVAHSNKRPKNTDDMYRVMNNLYGNSRWNSSVPLNRQQTDATKELVNIGLFLVSCEPHLSDILMPARGGKPKTKKNKQRRTRRTRRT